MMATRKRLVAGAAIALAVALVAGVAFLVCQVFFGPKTITAYFPTATAIYPERRGPGIGCQGRQDRFDQAGRHADEDDPQGRPRRAHTCRCQSRDRRPEPDRRPVRPADARVSKQWRPKMDDGAVIPADRTAVPVEWDEVKTQLMRLATELGPRSDVSGTSVSRFIDSAADALDNGNGEKLRDTLAQLSGVARVLRRGQRQHRRHHQEPADLRHRAARQQAADRPVRESAGDADQRGQRQQVRSGRGAVGPVGRDRRGAAIRRGKPRSRPSEQIQRLGSVTQILVDNRLALENVLHITPNAIANFKNIYYPSTAAR